MAGEARDNGAAGMACQLRDKVAVITGAGGGIGAALSEALRLELADTDVEVSRVQPDSVLMPSAMAPPKHHRI